MVATRAFLTSVFGIVLTIGLTCCGTSVQKPDGRVVLPNVKLTGCDSPRCSLIWPDKSSAANPAYPKHVSVDLENGSIRAVKAIYDQSVTMDEIKAALDQRYGKWALATSNPDPHLRLWRVEPEKFAISLFDDDDGTTTLHYVAFRENAQAYQDMINAMIQDYNGSEAAAGWLRLMRPAPKDPTVVNDLSPALVGKEITVHGKFSSAGKLGPYVEVANHQEVYLISRGSFAWGGPYTEIEGKLVSATGFLHFYKAPPFKPAKRAVAWPYDHFYFDAETVKLRLISP
jgi:hypothetical protein